MPTFSEDLEGTSINVDSNVAKTSLNGTAARKFMAPDVTSDEQVGENSNNIDGMIEQAAGLKSLAMAMESIADSSALELQQTRELLSTLPGKKDSDTRDQLPNITESDLFSASKVRSDFLARNLAELSNATDSEELSKQLTQGNPLSVFLKKSDSYSQDASNPVIPKLDFVSLELEKNRGSVDCFFSKLTFSLPTSQIKEGKIKAIRIFRAQMQNPKFSRGAIPTISARGLDILSTLKLRSRSKSSEQLSIIQKRYDEASVKNAISELNPVDEQTNKRIGFSDVSLVERKDKNSSIISSTAGNELSYIDVQSFLDPDKFGNLDRSVANDLNVLRNIKLQQDQDANVIQSPDFIKVFNPLSSVLLNKSQMYVKNTGVNLAVEKNNREEFREVSFISLDKLKSREEGSHTRFEFVDESIMFGRGYKYFLCTVNRDMIESVRSKIVELVVESVRVPDAPKTVLGFNVENATVLSINVEDRLIEKFEVWRREVNPALAKAGLLKIQTVIGRAFSENMFSKVGEAINGGNKQSGSTFYDRDVRPGVKYIYRVYSVDIFGNKSERPYEILMFVPDPKKTNELTRPQISTEIDSKTNKIKVTLFCNDRRVKNLFLTRRDLTIHQKVFTTPSQVNRVKFGNSNPGEGSFKFEDTILRAENLNSSWNGVFENTFKPDDNGNVLLEKITFIDNTVSLDHVYQYKIYGVDLFGNSTSHEISSPILVMNRPMVNSPVDVVAEVIQGRDFSVDGVKISWREGNSADVAENLFSSVNTIDQNVPVSPILYQVERRKVGEDRWEEFQLTEKRTIFDNSNTKLQFGPAALIENQTYMYRVKALQSGAFISNYSDYVEIFAGLPMKSPTNFKIKSIDASIKPFYIVLNWDTPIDSGVVDRWEIQRCEVNNIAAAKINANNPFDLAKLEFVSHRTIFRESSRNMSQDSYSKFNIRDANNLLNNRQLFTGQHNFQDSAVRFGNTFFYRIRCIGVDGRASDWMYRGVKLTSDTTERIISDLISPTARAALNDSLKPLVIDSLLKNQGMTSSISLQPSFSNPAKLPVATVGLRQTSLISANSQLLATGFKIGI